MTDPTAAGRPSPPFAARRGRLVPILLAAAVLVAIVASLCIGAYPMSFGQAGIIVAHLSWPFPLPDNPPWTVRELTVVQIVRLPRVLLAVLAGIGLGMSGAALQGMMKNPLVGPDLVGITAGAAFGGVLAMWLQWSQAGVVGLACGGGIGAMACTFGLSKLARGGADGMALILAGIFVGAFFLALVGLIEFIGPDWMLPRMTLWLLGSFVGADPPKVFLIAVPTLGAGAVLMRLRWRLNLLSLGDLDAATLGGDVRVSRWAIIGLVSLIVAAQVSVCGLIGWIGLVVPHLARMLVGPDHRRLLPASALLGGLLVLGLDDLARTVIRAEVPIGVMTALLGTPAICLLFWKVRTRGWTDG